MRTRCACAIIVQSMAVATFSLHRCVGSGEHESKWETSQIWPAPLVEIYEKDNKHLLQTLSSTHWSLHFDASSSGAKNDTRTALSELVEQARQRFSIVLDTMAPPNEAPINPKHCILSELAGIWLTIVDPEIVTLYHGVDESYTIDIPYPISNMSVWIELSAQTVYGAMRGLETIQQLLKPGWTESDRVSSVFVIPETPLHIRDAPAFPFRGLMIDTARHYLPIQLILDNLSVMAANKLNVLHWHLTDSQSWPWQSQTFPELSTYGAYCPTCVYTRDDIRTVVTTAATLGIRVIVEVDFPGHSQAVGASYPEFLSLCYAADTEDADSARILVRSEPLDVTEPYVWQFVQELYLELPQLFPDLWIHLGGDEVSLECWQNSTKIQTWMVQHNFTDTVQVLQYFEQDLIALVTGPLLRKRAIVWQDLFDSGVDLPRDTILDVWKEWTWEASLQNTTAAGYDILLSACWYLDHLNEDWWQFYQCDPLRGLRNNDNNQREHVLGGHASMWGERVDATNFYDKVWPRTSAVAEVLWSGSSTGSSSDKTEDTVSYSLVEARLEVFRCWMVERFQRPISPVAPGFCRGDEGPFMMLSDERDGAAIL